VSERENLSQYSVTSILGGDEMVQQLNESIRDRLLALTPSGDLMDLALQLREHGVESLLLCRPAGQIVQVITDRQIAQLASTEPSAALQIQEPEPIDSSPHSVVTTRAVVPPSRRHEDDLVPAEISRSSPKSKVVRRPTA